MAPFVQSKKIFKKKATTLHCWWHSICATNTFYVKGLRIFFCFSIWSQIIWVVCVRWWVFQVFKPSKLQHEANWWMENYIYVCYCWSHFSHYSPFKHLVTSLVFDLNYLSFNLILWTSRSLSLLIFQIMLTT